jgi:hypothetical protein
MNARREKAMLRKVTWSSERERLIDKHHIKTFSLKQTVETLMVMAGQAEDRFDAGEFRNGAYRAERVNWLQACVDNARNVRGRKAY